MDLSDRVLGTTVATQLRERGAATVLQIGSDRFTRGDLAHVDCFNFMAAANLSAILNRVLQVRHTRDVFDRVAPQDLAVPGLGAVSLAVLGAAFQAKGLGGTSPLESWVTRHLAKDAIVTTFASVKKHADQRARRGKARRRVVRFPKRRAS